MKIILDRETEVGKCDCERGKTNHFHYAEPSYATILAHTQASITSKGILKIEQHCYLRNGVESSKQSWVRPRLTLEPGLSCEDEMLAVAQTMHERFLIHTRQQVPDEIFV